MKIGFVWQCLYPWDVRLEKLMKVCAQDGHEVSLLCRWKHPLPEVESANGIRIWRMRAPGFLGSQRAAKFTAFPLFFNPFWFASLIRFLRVEKVDLLIVRDLPLAFLVGIVGRIFRTPVVLDMAENYPAALVAYQKAFYKPFLFGNAWLPKRYERISLALMDHTLVVTKEQVERLKALGVSASRVTLVGNTPETRFLPSPSGLAGDSEARSEDAGANLLFVGKLDAHRGVDLLVRAMPALLKEFPHLTLTLVGDGRERTRLEALVQSLGLEPNVNMPGWVQFEQIWKYIGRSTICLIPHRRNEHTNTTLPNKLFDYMAMGKPVVASDCVPIERVIRETNCGLVFESGNVVGLETKLRTLLSSPESRAMMGRNGRQSVTEKYNWTVDAESVLRVIQNSCAAASSRPKSLAPA